MTGDPLREALGLMVFTGVSSYVLWFASLRSSQLVRILSFVSFGGHVAIAMTIWYGVPTLIPGDSFVYHRQALGSLDARAGKEGFAIVLGGLYDAVASSPAVGLFLIAVLMGLLVVVVARTAERLGGPKASTAAAVMALLLPPFVWWGSQLLREAPMWILIAIAADLAVATTTEGLSLRRGVWLVVTCLGMLTIRAPVAAVFSIALVAGLLVASAPRPGDHLRKGVMIAGAAALLVVLYPRFEALQSLEEQNPAGIVSARNYLSAANTGFGEESETTTYGLVDQLPTALPLVTFGPLPWQLPAAGLPAVADTLAWWFVLFWAAGGFLALYRRVRTGALVLVAPAVAILFVLALTLANFGIVIRMRAMVLVLLLPYAAVGLALGAGKRRAGARPSGVGRVPQGA